MQKTWTKGRTAHGVEHLYVNTVIGSKVFVNIAPYFEYCISDDFHESGITKCMFSIENLAWLDVPDNEKNLSKEQRGPHGGRIMWFPPYDLKFNENVSVNWSQTEFIGRGEKIYTYTNTSIYSFESNPGIKLCVYVNGKELDEPYIAVEGLKVTPDMIDIYRKSTNTIKISLNNGVSIMKFNADEELCDKLTKNNTGYMEMDIVGKANCNEWNGIESAQIFIEDFNITDSNKYYF